MANRSKAKGTAHETQCVNYLRARLEDPRIERRALHGNKDMGDIYNLYAHAFASGIAECKAHKDWGPADLKEWQRQTEAEKANADADFALLIVKTPGCGPKNFGRTRTFLTVHDLLVASGIAYIDHEDRQTALSTWVELPLESVCTLIEGEPWQR